jgi:hypothetical protein
MRMRHHHHPACHLGRLQGSLLLVQDLPWPWLSGSCLVYRWSLRLFTTACFVRNRRESHPHSSKQTRATATATAVVVMMLSLLVAVETTHHLASRTRCYERALRAACARDSYSCGSIFGASKKAHSRHTSKAKHKSNIWSTIKSMINRSATTGGKYSAVSGRRYKQAKHHTA